jgi:CheY-like chemotaxis protein
VLITGFPSEDLAAAARERHGLVVLAKPFGFEQLESAILEVLARPPAPALPIAILELTGDRVVPRSPAALPLIGAAAAADSASLVEALGPRAANRVEEAVERWVALRPAGARNPWLLRAQPAPAGAPRLLALVPPSETVTAWAEPVRLLLGLRDPEEQRWPFAGRLLLVDPDPLERRRQTERLEQAGAVCYAAPDSRHALRLFEHDEAIAFVVIHCASLEADGAALVARVRELDRDTLLIGTGPATATAACAHAGLTRFLPRPWGFEELLAAIEA